MACADAAVNHAMALQHICRHRCVHDVPLRGIFDDFNMQNIGQTHEAPLSGNKRIAMPPYYRSSKRDALPNSSFPTRYAFHRPRPAFARFANWANQRRKSTSTVKGALAMQPGHTQYSRASKPKPQPRAASWRFPNARYSYSRFLLASWARTASPRFTASVTSIPVTIGK